MTRRIFKFIRISIISAVILAVISAAAASLIFYFYPKDSVMAMIKAGAEKALKRQVSIESLEYSIRGVLLNNVTVYETLPDGSKSELVRSEEVVINFSLISILKKDIRIDTIYCKKFRLAWEFAKEGDNNLKRLFSDMAQGSTGSGEKKKIKISRILLSECSFVLVNPPEKYKPLEGEYIIDCTINIEENNKLSISDSKIILPDKRGELYPEVDVNTTGVFTILGRVKGVNLDIPWTYGFAKNKINLPFQTANCYIDNLEITRTSVKGHAKGSSTLKGTSKVLNVDGWCTVDIPAKMTYLSDIKGKLNESSASLNSMAISSAGGGIRKFSASDLSVDFDDARSFSKLIPAGLYGSVRGNLSYDGNSFSGRIELANTGYNGNAEFVSDINTVIDINSGNIKKESIPCKIFGNVSTISVATTDSSFKNFYIIIRSDRIEADKIKFKKSKLQEESAGSGKTAGGSGSSVSGSGQGINIKFNLAGKVQVRELVYENYIVRNIDSEFRASGSSIKIPGLTADIFSGKLYGSGKIDISGSIPDAQIQVKYNNIKIQDIALKNENMKDRFFGFADGAANLNFQVKENMLSTVKGNTTFSITRGKVVNTGVQNGLIIFLAELRYKLKDLEFQKIYGNIDINRNIFIINSFIFNAEDVRLLMNGQIDSDLVAKNMSIKLEFNNHFIKDIPRPAVTVFGEYASGNWYIIPFAINGSITDSKNIKILKKNQ
ncbi:MAG TPA: AsmA-like C-terminal region-containing protein [Spirochaetota bacterium]|nr:AsmA-like C-terminal region-containing protein [Spirochaetota bacterium]